MLSRWGKNQCLPYKECACVYACVSVCRVCVCVRVYARLRGEARSSTRVEKTTLKQKQNSCKLGFEGGLVFLVRPKAAAEKPCDRSKVSWDPETHTSFLISDGQIIGRTHTNFCRIRCTPPPTSGKTQSCAARAWTTAGL